MPVSKTKVPDWMFTVKYTKDCVNFGAEAPQAQTPVQA